MTRDLFGFDATPGNTVTTLGEQAMVLHAFALAYAEDLLPAIQAIIATSPWRQMMTPGGHTMSVAMTNCGHLGWITDRQGYRYSHIDPLTGHPWPAMPKVCLQLAQAAATAAGFPDFRPDACLVNRYLPGTTMSLHQDNNEADSSAPIVSVSLGMPAIFLFGGHHRQDPARRMPLFHGDVAVWGGINRLRFHGIMPVKAHTHFLLGEQRINLTFRQAR